MSVVKKFEKINRRELRECIKILEEIQEKLYEEKVFRCVEDICDIASDAIFDLDTLLKNHKQNSRVASKLFWSIYDKVEKIDNMIEEELSVISIRNYLLFESKIKKCLKVLKKYE